MIRRFELTDKQFALIADLLPAWGKRGGRWNDHRTTRNGIFWRLHPGAQWREGPKRYGKAKSIYDRLHLLALLRLRLNEAGRLEVVLWCVDATSIRASRSAAGAAREKTQPYDPADQALGRSRGGFGTKVHLVVDGNGIPLAATITAGQVHESKQMAATLEQVCLRGGRGRARTRPKQLAGDQGYSDPAVRAYLRRRGIMPVIPTRKNQRANLRFDKATYSQRNVVERSVSWLKENRPLATRRAKLAVNYLATVQLAMIWRCLGLLADPSAEPSGLSWKCVGRTCQRWRGSRRRIWSRRKALVERCSL